LLWPDEVNDFVVRNCQGTWLEMVNLVNSMIPEQRKLDDQTDRTSQSWIKNQSLLAADRIDDIQKILEGSVLDRICIDTIGLC